VTRGDENQMEKEKGSEEKEEGEVWGKRKGQP
jgi:hypothetical protein